MTWAIVYLAGACCLVSASCARDTDASSLRILRGLGSVLMLAGGIPMLVAGSFVETLLVGGLCVAVMAFATRIERTANTAPGWFAAPGLLVAASVLLLVTAGVQQPRNTPRIVFDEDAQRREQLVILEDASTELELLELRGFPRAVQGARDAQNWTRLGDLETMRETIPLLRKRIGELRRELSDASPGETSGQAVRSIAERISRIDAFVNPSE